MGFIGNVVNIRTCASEFTDLARVDLQLRGNISENRKISNCQLAPSFRGHGNESEYYKTWVFLPAWPIRSLMRRFRKFTMVTELWKALWSGLIK